MFHFSRENIYLPLINCPSVSFVGIFPKPRLEISRTDESAQPRLPMTVICDNLREPGNLGSLLRSAAGVGCRRIVLSKGMKESCLISNVACTLLWNKGAYCFLLSGKILSKHLSDCLKSSGQGKCPHSKTNILTFIGKPFKFYKNGFFLAKLC
jgi:hypothetical protein